MEQVEFSRPFRIFAAIMLGAIIILSALSFLGCFGDVIYQFTNMSGHYNDPEIISISAADYYYSMMEDIKNAYNADSMKYVTQVGSVFFLQLMFYGLAITTPIFAIIFSIISLIRVTKKMVLPHEKLLYIFPLCSLPHPLLFRLMYGSYVKFTWSSFFPPKPETITYQYTILGWGTYLVFFASIIALILLLVFSSSRRIKTFRERIFFTSGGYTATEICQLIFNVALVIIVSIAVSHSIIIDGYGNTGHGGTMADYLNLLINEEQHGAQMPQEAPLLLSSFVFMLFATLLTVTYFFFTNVKKQLVSLIIGATALTFFVLGFSYSLHAIRVVSGDTGSDHVFYYSILGIIIYVLLAFSLSLSFARMRKSKESSF